MRWLDQMERDGNKLQVHPGVMRGDVKAKFALYMETWLPTALQARRFEAISRGCRSVPRRALTVSAAWATIPASFVAKMADKAASDKRISAIHHYSGFGAAAVKRALEVNHKFSTGQFTGTGTNITMTIDPPPPK